MYQAENGASSPLLYIVTIQTVSNIQAQDQIAFSGKA
jgi:hypothetical protein